MQDVWTIMAILTCVDGAFEISGERFHHVWSCSVVAHALSNNDLWFPFIHSC
jgi:hypothetical protein